MSVRDGGAAGRRDRAFGGGTSEKKSLSCSYSIGESRPRKILATKVPPSRSSCVVIEIAESTSCAWVRVRLRLRLRLRLGLRLRLRLGLRLSC